MEIRNMAGEHLLVLNVKNMKDKCSEMKTKGGSTLYRPCQLIAGSPAGNQSVYHLDYATDSLTTK
jgi:hypothetical protein